MRFVVNCLIQNQTVSVLGYHWAIMFSYVGESKRSWKSQGGEQKPGTNGNIGSAVKQYAETTNHNIHPNYADILERGAKTKNKRLFLESLHQFLNKNSVNERAPFPTVYASQGRRQDFSKRGVTPKPVFSPDFHVVFTTCCRLFA